MIEAVVLVVGKEMRKIRSNYEWAIPGMELRS